MATSVGCVSSLPTQLVAALQRKMMFVLQTGFVQQRYCSAVISACMYDSNELLYMYDAICLRWGKSRFSTLRGSEITYHYVEN